MTELNIKYLQVACNMAGISIDEHYTELIGSLYELVLEKGGSVSLDEVLTLKHKLADDKTSSKNFDGA